jgi:Ca2+-binding EF-hand superfamily protein
MSAAALQRDSAIWRAQQMPELLTRKQAVEAAAANGLSFTEQLRAYLSSNLSRVIDLLREWDEDEDGYVDRSEFRKALPALGLAIDRQGADELYDTFDADGSGLITLDELTRQLRPAGEHEHVEFATNSKNAIELRGELAYQEKRSKVGGMQALSREGLESEVPLIDQIKQALAGGFGRVLDIFREWDEDGSGTITKKEFRRALPLLGLRLEKKDSDDFFDSFDRDLSGELDYRELHAQLRLRVSDRQSTKRSKRLSPEKRTVGASLVGAAVAVEAEIAERGMHNALQKAEAEARQKLIRVQRELARVTSQSARAKIRRNNRALVVEVQQDIKQRIGSDLSSKFKNVRAATDEEVQTSPTPSV